MLSAYGTNNLDDSTTIDLASGGVFIYASQVYYQHENGAVFSAHIDDLDDELLDVRPAAYAVTIPTRATKHAPSDDNEDDNITVWTDRCDACVLARDGGLRLVC